MRNAMMKSGFWSLLATAATLVVVTGQVYAGQQINLVMDRSIMVTVAGEPSTVVIGNPSIADISLNGKQVFLHGHSAGDTNLIILDKDGNQLADFELSVSQYGFRLQRRVYAKPLLLHLRPLL
jgi:Flp pilus assembly secretin CpaC